MTASPSRRREVRVRLGMWWRILLMAGMMAALASMLVQAVHAAGVAWQGSYLVATVALLPLETYASQRAIRRRALLPEQVTRFRLAEAGVLVLALQALRFLDQGLPHIGGRVERLLNLEFFVGTLLLLGLWSMAISLIRWFADLDYQPQEKAPPVTSPDYDLWVSSRIRYVEHTAAFQRIFATYLVGGVLVLFLGGVSRVDLAAIIDFQRGTIRSLIGNAVIYFVLGLALIAEARLSLLHNRWQHEEVTVSRSVSRRWPFLVGGLLFLAVVVALLLPVDYSVGLIEALQQGLNYLVTAMVTIAYTLMYLVGLLLYPLQWLMSVASGGGGEQPSLPEFAAPTATATAAGTPPLLETLKALLFWLVAIGIAGYALYNFAREHGADLNKVPLLRRLWLLVQALGKLWRGLRRGAAGAGKAMMAALRRRTRSAQGGRRALSRRLRHPGQMSARELAQYYYLTTVQRAEAAGLRRRPSQTADEFSCVLTASLAAEVPTEVADVEQDVGALTLAFVEARYSAHDMEIEKARRLRPFWEHVREALRALRRDRQSRA